MWKEEGKGMIFLFFLILFFQRGVARDKGNLKGFFFQYVEGGWEGVFFFLMLKRDERGGFFFLQVHRGVRVGLIN
jgi:hypothetical protein